MDCPICGHELKPTPNETLITEGLEKIKALEKLVETLEAKIREQQNEINALWSSR